MNPMTPDDTELRKDRERLDWLESHKPPGWESVLIEYYDGEFTQVNFCHPGYDGGDDDAQFYVGDTWREAIDAAMANTPYQEETDA